MFYKSILAFSLFVGMAYLIFEYKLFSFYFITKCRSLWLILTYYLTPRHKYCTVNKYPLNFHVFLVWRVHEIKENFKYSLLLMVIILLFFCDLVLPRHISLFFVFVFMDSHCTSVWHLYWQFLKAALKTSLWWWLINTGFITHLRKSCKIYLLFGNFMYVYDIFLLHSPLILPSIWTLPIFT